MSQYDNLDIENPNGYFGKYIYPDLSRIPDVEWDELIEKLASIRYQINEKDESTIRLIINKYIY
jgi:hypothetical protein